MKNGNQEPQPLTESEQIEFNQLKKELFVGFMFVVFDDKQLESAPHKRYDELLLKKMQFMAYQEYLVTNN